LTSFTTNLRYCDGSLTEIILETACTIPVSVLRDSPFNLPWGSSVVARVLATNNYGSSDYSLNGNGAIIITSPDAPTSLAENTLLRSPTTLGIKWTAPSFTGGTSIIDYRINIAEVDGNFAVLATGVVSTLYTVTSLTSGVTYQFKIEARNSYGFSVYSDILTLLCAYKPEAPSAPTTLV